MKRKTQLFSIMALAVVAVLAIGVVAFVQASSLTPASIRPAKSIYLLDPYYWVYSASKFTYWWPPRENPKFWDENGHNLSIGFDLHDYEPVGDLTYKVMDGEAVLKADSPLALIDGTYGGGFEISETDVGGELFKPGALNALGKPMVPKVLTVVVSDSLNVVASKEIRISRWGCDRCHVAKEIAVPNAKTGYPGLYSWCAPTGGPLGPHYWGNVLGRNGGRPGFTYKNLTDSTYAHSPKDGGEIDADRDGVIDTYVGNPLDRPPYHLATNTKQYGNPACSPCHNGSGRLRYDWRNPDPSVKPFVHHERGCAVKCNFCHGMSGGYVPTDPTKPWWEDYGMDWN